MQSGHDTKSEFTQEERDFFVRAWCVFPVKGGAEHTKANDAVRIGAIEEIGTRFGIPYLCFRAEHNMDRVIELLGSWTIRNDNIF
jgi:hypothetical protein